MTDLKSLYEQFIGKWNLIIRENLEVSQTGVMCMYLDLILDKLTSIEKILSCPHKYIPPKI